MPPHPLFGPSLASYRTSVSVLHVVLMLSLGPLVIGAGVAAGLLRDLPWLLLLSVPAGFVLTVAVLAWQVWSHSATLRIYHHGVSIGRMGGRPRDMWFGEIHPATIRVFEDIDSLRSLPYRSISTHWHISGGADLAVTFLGPDRASDAGRRLRHPAPGRGIVVFASRRAPEIARHLREGLERSGCPAHLARWSERFDVSELEGIGRMAQRSVPGMRPDWRP